MNRSDKINEQNQTILELENEKKNLYNQLEGKNQKITSLKNIIDQINMRIHSLEVENDQLISENKTIKMKCLNKDKEIILLKGIKSNFENIIQTCNRFQSSIIGHNCNFINDQK